MVATFTYFQMTAHAPGGLDETDRRGGTPQRKRRSSKGRVLATASLVIGLALFMANYILHINIAAQYLSLEKCHRSFQQNFTNFALADYVDLSSFQVWPLARLFN